MGPSIKRYFISTLKRRLPVTKWIRYYDLMKLRGDIIAGLAVGLMLVPQSLAIATVAGLPPHYGLYSSFPGPFMYFILGTSKDMNIGPTMIIALVSSRYNTHHSPEVAAMLTLLSGAILTMAGLFRLGFLVRFISIPVFSAFIAAAAISISVNQLQDLLGLPSGPRPFFQRLVHILTNLKRARAGDTTLGITCLLLLISLGVVAKHLDQRASSRLPSITTKLIKFLNIAKSALIAILASILSYLVYVYGNKSTFKIAGELPEGFPRVQNPLRQIQISPNKTLTISDTVSSLGAGIGIVPLMLYLESIAVAKALAMKNNYEVDSSQELIAVGASNVFASFFNAFPITGSFARSVINSVSGAASPISGVVAATLVLLALQFITSFFKYIPVTSLAAMVIASVVTMIDISMPRKLWKTDRLELLPYLASFAAAFYEMEFGIIVGTIVSFGVLMFKVMVPSLLTEDINPKVVHLAVNGPLWFPSADNLIEKLQGLSERWKHLQRTDFECFEIKLNFSKANALDFTVLVKLEQKILELAKNGVKVVFVEVNEVNMRNRLMEIGFLVEDTAQCKPEELQTLCFESSV